MRILCFVKETSTNTKFKFGDGAECVSKSLVKLPVVIGNVKGSIETNVVENEIPMLLTQKSLKSAGCNLDFTTDTATLLRQNIKLTKTNTGHYCVPLSKYILGTTSDTKIVLHTNCLEGLTIPQKKQKALKLHKQFSHASKEKLCKLVKDQMVLMILNSLKFYLNAVRIVSYVKSSNGHLYGLLLVYLWRIILIKWCVWI